MLPPISQTARSQVSRFTLIIVVSLSGVMGTSCTGLAVPQQPADVSPTPTQAQEAQAPPFFGRRYFNFYGGSGTGQTITIEMDGATTVEFHGVESSTVEYRGNFDNPLTLSSGERLLIDGDKIYQVGTDNQVLTGCNGEGVPCVADLSDVTETAISDGLYIIGDTDQGLEVFGDRYRYYSEGGEEEWRPIAELTAIQEGLIFDGRNYWCINTPTEAGVCTRNGWRTAAESLQDQAAGINHEAYVAKRELSLGGFQIGDPPTDVINQLGQPTQIISEYFSRYEYPDLTLWFDEDFLVDMRSTSANYCTPSGACPGMDIHDVRQKYGFADISDDEEGSVMRYYVEGESCWLEFMVDGEQIKAVSVLCQI